jgi:hypothetical protein
MDASTTALTGLPDLTVAENISNILPIYAKFRANEANISLEVVRNIFNEIDRVYYNGTFSSRFLVSGPVAKRPSINYNDTGKSCDTTDAFLEALAYDKNDGEFARHDYGFNIALTCINSIKTSKIYYSGGYITKSKIMYIILMLLHESIHIIEYKDSRLTKAKSSHTVYFYKYGYKRFKIVSRLSNMMENTSLLNGDLGTRTTLIAGLSSRSDTSDGIAPLNDHSSYQEKGRNISLGYIVHDAFRTTGGFRYLEDIRIGGKRKTRRNRRKTKRNVN